ncbi:hypothetical protein LCGC14_1813850 [marine sediment metagenome]|uniref:Uncharacterized protein n=1 Tax=marine sediment metagenome TaxID=412755 RepID=A0A0F9J0Q5_9ZZZZ
MKHLRRFAVVGLALGLVGCGTNLGQQVTLGDARAVCLAWDGTVDALANFNTLVLAAEALRNDGVPESMFIGALFDVCDPNDAGCFSCFTHLAAAVWN